jgi:hypothetical protein
VDYYTGGSFFYWLDYINDKFVKEIKWSLLEIKFPQETVKSPKAMEQFFSGLHAVQRRLKFKDKYIRGEIPTWFSIEIIGKEGKIYIFVRTPEKFRNLVESQIYAQYPDAEISEVEDYVNNLPMMLKFPKLKIMLIIYQKIFPMQIMIFGAQNYFWKKRMPIPLELIQYFLKKEK